MSRPDDYHRRRLQIRHNTIADMAALAELAQYELGLDPDGMCGPATLAAVTRYLAARRPPTGADLARMARSQIGDRYVFGAEAPPDALDPVAFDCSELVEWCCAQLGVACVDGSWRQWQRSVHVPIERAIETPGALLFRFEGDPGTSQRPESAHVAISLGEGWTVEARSRSHGVGAWSVYGRGWTHAGLVAGLRY